MPFIQQTFLGASISSFDSSIGWNGARGSLSAVLVIDPLNRDVFLPPIPGSPVFFLYSNWIYGGVFRDYVVSTDTQQGTQIRVNLTDIGEIAQNVQLVLDGYTGQVNVANMFNVYGYLENQGFGNSQVNEAGMDYTVLLNTLQFMAENPGPYGNFISLVGNNYRLDLSQMPKITGYRIQGPVINLVDFIGQVCQDFGLDYFFKLTKDENQNNVIQVVTVSRASNGQPGMIDAFIVSTPGASAKSIGFELRNETTAKFLVGDNILNLVNFTTTFPSGYNLKGFAFDDKQFPSPWILNPWHNPENGRNIPSGDITGLTPFCFPPPLLTQITKNEILPFWGTDTFGYTFLPSYAQESAHYIDYLGECWDDFDSITDGVGEDKSTLFGTVTQTKSLQNVKLCGKSILSTLVWYHDQVFFFSPIPSYPFYISIGELRAALISQDAWENYIASRCKMTSDLVNNFVFLKENAQNNYEIYSSIKPFVPTKKQKKPIFSNMKTRLDDLPGISNTTDVTNPALLGTLFSGGQLDPKLLKNTTADSLNSSADRFKADRMFLAEVYKAVHDLAQDSYGKKFCVSMRNIYVKLNENLRPIYSDDPSSEGYFQGSNFMGLNSIDVNFFKNPENKIDAFVMFDSVNFIDVSKLDVNDYFIKDTAGSGNVYSNQADIYDRIVGGTFTDSARLYLRCQVEPDLVFGSYNLSAGGFNYSDPRVVVDLPYPVYFRPDCFINGNREKTDSPTNPHIYPNGGASCYNLLGNAVGTTITQILRDNIGKLLNSIGSKTFSEEIAPMVLIPRGCAFGLKSNTQTYGPWTIQGVPGRVEFEEDNSLNPWTFNGYDNMNLAAQAKVTGAGVQMQQGETGTIEVPDVPAIQMGDAIIAGGPILTDINVNVGPQGVTTTYNMRSFSPAFGGLSKILFERLRKAGQKTQITPKTEEKIKNQLFAGRVLTEPDRGFKKLDVRLGTPHEMLIGQVIGSNGPIYSGSGTIIGSGVVPFGSVVTETLVEARPELSNNYINIGGMSFDGMFRPYAVVGTNGSGNAYTDASGNITGLDYNPLPAFLPEQASGVITPFPSGHDVDFVIRGSDFPSDLATVKGGYDSGNIYRGIGLRLPAVGVGFGQTMDGGYVPGNSKGYDPDYAYNSTNWKAGPIDFRWDNTRGVWGFAGTSMFFALAQENVFPDQGAYNFRLVGTSGNVLAQNTLMQPICSGSYALLLQTSNLPTISGVMTASGLQPSGSGVLQVNIPVNYAIVLSQFNAAPVSLVSCTSGVQISSTQVIYTPAAVGLYSASIGSG